ncbi:MAG: glycogen/starch/alpha-glucan phosphorylase, partial [Blastocatellia bacterium]
MTQNPPSGENARESLKKTILRHARYALGKHRADLTRRDIFHAVGLAIRETLIDGMLATEDRYQQAGAKRLYYLSMEFLMGRSLGNNLFNLGLFDLCREAVEELGFDLEEVRQQECDAALGNGGLGRLAACFLDSLATLDLPGFGYGINYEYGLFKQEIDNGHQKERPDNWLEEGTPWQIERLEEAVLIPLYGRVEDALDRDGNYNPMWLEWQLLIGVPHDMPIAGYGGRTINYLRLYSARASREFDMRIFNEGDYLKAVEQKMSSETISKVLYPSDSLDAGRELRLIQEYFFVACAVRDIVRRYERRHENYDAFPSQVAIQLNDTHPALAVAELMRLLIDEKLLPWERAWEITRASLGYTNHTLLPEALERWPVDLFARVLPRHLQIIYEINRRFLEEAAERWPEDGARAQRMSVVEEGERKHLRMAHLAIIGSHSVNGVAALHSELVKSSLVPDFYALWPERFNNKTNGVTPRRWLLKANPRLAGLITDALGDGWITDLDRLRGLEAFTEDAGFRDAFHRVKRANKERLAQVVRETAMVRVDPDSLFDIQAKRIHEYKRQLLNVLHVIDEYLGIVEDGREPAAPRTVLFAGKAAPGYWAAKQLIKLVHNLGRVINDDPRVRGMLKVAFIPDYRVSLAERIIPAADLSEQISTAGKEASGTGNMKFAMNGALTIGTLDGANIEIREEVGEENIFIFGLTAEEITGLAARGDYRPWDYCRDPRINRIVAALDSDLFCPREPGLFDWIARSLTNAHDEYFHLADLPSYLAAQEQAAREFSEPAIWAPKAILNVARMGKFSSDRTIAQYAEEIWGLNR